MRNGAGCKVKHSKLTGAIPPLSHMPSQHEQGQLYLDWHNISEILSSLQKNFLHGLGIQVDFVLLVLLGVTH